MKLRYVRNAPFFSALSEQEQARVSEQMHLEHRHSGEMLFRKGEEASTVYLIKSGWVQLLAEGGTVLASQGPGSLVGETDLFLDRPRSLDARTATDVEVWVLDGRDLAELMAETPEIGLKLTLAFGSRLAFFDQYLVDERLRPLYFLSGLGNEALLAVASRLMLIDKKKNDLILEAGQPAEAWFIVESGCVHLHSSEEEGDFSELGSGETFGEMAVLTGKPHTRTSQAASDTLLWKLPIADFQELADRHPSMRRAVSEALREPLLPEDQSRAVARLSTMPLFANLAEEVLRSVSQRLLLRHVPAGEAIFAKGMPADALYLIDSGQVEIVSDSQTRRGVISRLGPDEFFGETALLTGKPRSTGARAATHANLWVLYRSDFEDLVNRHPTISLALSRALSERLAEMNRHFTESHLRGLKLLAGLTAGQLEDISRRLSPVRFRKGESPIREGDPGNVMYFIESGRVRVVRGQGETARSLAEMDSGDLFGEMALLTDSPRSATVIALTDLDLWALNREDFDELVAAYPNLALGLGRLLSERLRETDERFLQEHTRAPQPAPTRHPVAAAMVQRQPVSRSVPGARPVPTPRLASQPAQRSQPVAATRAVVPGEKPGILTQLGDGFGNLADWFGSLSMGAKWRLVLTTLPVMWIVCIAAPALLLSTLAADDVTNLQGAISFVRTAPPEVVVTTTEPVERPADPTAMVTARQEPTAQPTVVAVQMPTAEAENMALEVPEDPVEEASIESGLSEPMAPLSATDAIVTPTPWIIVVTNTPLPPTATAEPTATPLPPPPTATARPRVVQAAQQPTVAPTAVERPQPARDLDPRLAPMGVVVQPIGVRPGQQYWRLVKAYWQNKEESGNDHTIYINVLDENGARIVGQLVEIRWSEGALTVRTEDKPPYEYAANFPMYGTLGSYSVSIPGLPSDTVVGMGMGTVEQPHFTIHTNFLLTFQRVTR